MIEEKSTEAPYYDLQGRPVDNPARGIYIKDGKKTAVDWQQSSNDNENRRAELRLMDDGRESPSAPFPIGKSS